MHALARMLKSFAADEAGATAIEYGLIVALVFLVVVSAINQVSSETISMYAVIVDAMT